MKGGFRVLQLFLVIFAASAGAFRAWGASDPGLVLTSGSLSSNQFEFALNAESGVSYTIEASTNLTDWVALVTNTGPDITRAITITNPPDGQSFYRAARKPIPVQQFALAAVGLISLSGGTTVDSFDSSVGPYNVFTNRNANGNIETDSTNYPAVSIGGSHVFGRVMTGPGGIIAISNGAIGDVAWNTNNNVGVEGGGWTNNDINISFPSNSPPLGPYLAPTLVSTNGSNITLLDSGVYQASALTSSSSAKPWVVTGNAVLWVTGSAMVSGSGYVLVQPGASLQLYVGGATALFSGGGIVNKTGLAANVSYIGLNSNTSFVYAGSAALIGTVNAPQADITLSGASGTYGAVIGKTITLSGSAGMHFDESLAANGPTR